MTSTDEGGPSDPRPSLREAAEKQTPFKALRETVLLLAFAILLALVVKTFFVQSFYIPSESMEPGLMSTTGSWSRSRPTGAAADPQRGDVIVFDDPGGWLQRPRVRPADVAAGPRAGQDRPLPDRRPPREAGHRRAPATRSSAATTRAGSWSTAPPIDEDDFIEPQKDPPKSATARCPAGRWTATGPPARSRRHRSSSWATTATTPPTPRCTCADPTPPSATPTTPTCRSRTSSARCSRWPGRSAAPTSCTRPTPSTTYPTRVASRRRPRRADPATQHPPVEPFGTTRTDAG